MTITKHDLMSKMKGEMCDPKKHFITYCIDYQTEKCEETCHYARSRRNYQECLNDRR